MSTKRPVFVATVWVSALMFFFAPAVQAAETIPQFAATASLSSDRELIIRETITYDFGETSRHGIYRVIPVRTERNGGLYGLRLVVSDVTRDAQSEPYSQSTKNGELTVKIGRGDTTINGSHVYGMTYSTVHAINFFPEHDELYWNVTGDGWQVPVERAQFTLTVPELTSGMLTTECFTGALGSTEHACTMSVNGNDVTIVSTRTLLPGEGLTVVIGLPKGVIAAPTSTDILLQILRDNGVLFLPVLAFIIMFWIWRKKGRDPKIGTIIPEYEPPEKLSPALVGAVMTSGDVPARTLTATIIDLARRGYLKIRFDEEKTLLGLSSKQTYTFVKQQSPDEACTEYERTLLEGLFESKEEVDLDELQEQKFYEDVAEYKKQVQALVDQKGVFVANPTAVRSAYIIFGLLIISGIFFLPFTRTLIGVLSAVAAGIIVICFGIIMPKRTAAGAKLLTDIKGFQWFLSVTEKDRLAFHNAPERTPEQFMALLPYAIVLGVEKKWAEQFASMDIPPPSWAQGSAMHHLGMMHLISSIDGMHAAAAASGYAPPSSAGSGGSGFSGGGSGGGFGGGGGGSW